MSTIDRSGAQSRADAPAPRLPRCQGRVRGPLPLRRRARDRAAAPAAGGAAARQRQLRRPDEVRRTAPRVPRAGRLGPDRGRHRRRRRAAGDDRRRSQDFIIANHFLEHTENPIGTIETHLGKLKPGGVLFYAVPDKRYTFDFRRPVTPIEHMVADYEQGPERSRQRALQRVGRLVIDEESARGRQRRAGALRRSGSRAAARSWKRPSTRSTCTSGPRPSSSS